MSLVPSFFGPWSVTHYPFNFDSMDYPFHARPIEVTLPTEKFVFPICHTVWNETSAAHTLTVNLPGFNQNEVKVEIEQDKLIKISAEQDKQVEEKHDKWQHVGRSSKRFLQRFKLPENALLKSMKTEFEDGVLTVTFPKGEKKEPGRVVELS